MFEARKCQRSSEKLSFRGESGQRHHPRRGGFTKHQPFPRQRILRDCMVLWAFGRWVWRLRQAAASSQRCPSEYPCRWFRHGWTTAAGGCALSPISEPFLRWSSAAPAVVHPAPSFVESGTPPCSARSAPRGRFAIRFEQFSGGMMRAAVLLKSMSAARSAVWQNLTILPRGWATTQSAFPPLLLRCTSGLAPTSGEPSCCVRGVRMEHHPDGLFRHKHLDLRETSAEN